jgi:serine protease Do
MQQRFISRYQIVVVALVTMALGGLLGVSPALFALDIFGSSKTQESSPTPPSGERLPSFAETAKAAKPAVVNISTTQKMEAQRRPRPGPTPGPFGGDDPFEEFFRRFFGERPPSARSLGSGFVISQDGYIVTNNHVIEGAETIEVRLTDHNEYQAKLIGTDDKTDIALIKIEPKGPLSVVTLGKSSDLQVGDWVVAIGNPFGLEQTVTAGIVSAKGRVIGSGPYDDYIQTDASINPGNSGGPLLNLKSEVVGINTAIFSRTGGNIGIGFAIPIDMARSIIDQLKTTGKVTRGWLGVAIQQVTPELGKSFGLEEARGALVAEVTTGGPAEKVGIERGDIIVEFNGEEVKDSHELPAMVANTAVGSKAEVKVLRGGKEKRFTVNLGELPAQIARAGTGEEQEEGWGLTVADITPDIARRFQLESDKGVVITEVESDSPAGQAGLRPGDVIEEANRQTVSSVGDFTKAIEQGKGKETLLLLARRGTFSAFYALKKAG